MFEIRHAGIDDCGLINRLAAQVWEPTYGRILSAGQLAYMFDRMYAPENLKKQMTEEGHHFMIACRDEQPCGYVSVERQHSGLFHIQKIYVLPTAQGTGAGRFLMEEAFRYIRSLCPRCTVELNVNRENPARKFYEKMGFRIVRTGDFPIGNGYYMNDYIMAIELS